jgi:nucleotide-binding universal stress UspA family protein
MTVMAVEDAMHPLTIVCPVDYSECSKHALRYAGALAEHFGTGLIVLHVVDPILAAATSIQQIDLLDPVGDADLRSLVERLVPASVRDRHLERMSIMGSPSAEILKLVKARRADLVVIGTHGFSGVKKLFFGSTLKAVLAKVRVPVLAVPLGDGETAIEAPLISSGPIVAPVDFSPESRAAAHAAAGLARALKLPLTLLHVSAPPQLATLGWQRAASPGDRTASSDPNVALHDLSASFPADVQVDIRLLHGAAAEEIARYAREKRAAFIVMSLGSSAMRGRTPGSIAYRVLCLAPVPILALPERHVEQIGIDHVQPGVRLTSVP